MYASSVGILLVSFLFICASFHLIALRRNLQAVKNSGLPYILVPAFFQFAPWLPKQELLWHLLNKLPAQLTEPWLSLLAMKRFWHDGYSAFKTVELDTFVAVASTGNVLWTCEPEIVSQLCARRSDFPNLLDALQVLDISGSTAPATAGATSRFHGNATSPAFNDTTHDSVWTYTLQTSAEMVNSWASPSHHGCVKQLRADVTELTLKIFSYCAYGKETVRSTEVKDSSQTRTSHALTYNQAITSLLENALTVFLNPPTMLKHWPFDFHVRPKTVFQEAKSYVQELFDEKLHEIEVHGTNPESSLLDALIRASSTSPEPPRDGLSITPNTMLSNTFIFGLAGQETSANTVAFALTILACLPKLQQAVQTDLDRILGNKSTSAWSYSEHFPKLSDAYPGAILNEILRLYPVVPFFPKIVDKAPLPIIIQGKQYHIPVETLVLINSNAIHRNPKYWPQEAEHATSLPKGVMPDPLTSFIPELWLKDPQSPPVTHKSLPQPFNPVPGSYITLPEELLACMGQRFAKTEFVALLSRILKEYSVELDVSSYGEDLAEKEVWQVARANAMRELSSGMTLFFAENMGKSVPVRIVKRGEEQHVYL